MRYGRIQLITMLASILKYAGAVVSTALAIGGLVATFRGDRQTGKVTFGGRMLLSGIIISGFLIIATQLAEDVEQKAERNELLEQVARGQYALRDARLSCWLDVSLGHIELAGYRARILPAVTNARAALIAGAASVPGISGWGWSNTEPVNHVSVCRDSPLFPDAATERFAYGVFERMEVRLQFYRKPIQIVAYPFHASQTRIRTNAFVQPDLVMTFRNAYERPGHLCIQYDFDRQVFGLQGFDLETEPRYWNGSGEIISLVDLRGAQMFVEITPLASRADEATPAARVIPDLRRLALQTGELDALWFSIDSMRRHTGDDGLPFYEYRFPDSTREILRLSGRR